MPARRKLTDQGRDLIIRVFRARQELPSNKELARELGVSPATVDRTIYLFSRASRTAAQG